MNRMIPLLFISACVAGTAGAPAQPSSPGPSEPVVLNTVKIQGSLDLENEVPIRWKRPDGSGYVNVFTLDKNGTLRLCDDPYYYEAGRDRGGRVIEIRNPKTKYPDFRLPITRSDNLNADSKLRLRSLTLEETNDPSEINLIRTGNDKPGDKDENAPISDGAVTGLIRWMGRVAQNKETASRQGGYVSAAELIGRCYGTVKEHYGALVFQIVDSRAPQQKGGVLLVMKPGVRIGSIRGAGGGVTGGMLEVDSMDERPVIFRRPEAAAGQAVTLALANGAAGTVADNRNTLGLIKADSLKGGPLRSRLEIQTNKGGSLETDLVLPVPAAQVLKRAAQMIPSGELVPLRFERSRYDTDAMHEEKDGAGRLTCRTAGRYAVSAAVEFSANGKGHRQLMVRRNGRDIVAAMRVPAVEGETTQITFTAPPIELRPGDYVELLVRQTSGERLEVPVHGEVEPVFSMARAG